MLDPDIIQAAWTGSIRGTATALGYDEKTLREWAAKDGRISSILYADKKPAAPVREFVNYGTARAEAELRDLKRLNKKQAEILGEREAFIAQVISAARTEIEPTIHFEAEREKVDTLPRRAVVLPIFDVQYGQLVHEADVSFGKGAFSTAIFDERLTMYVEKVEALLLDRATSTQLTELHIVLGGDLVEGDQIFAGQTWQLETHPIRQVLDLRDKLGQAIDHLQGFARAQLGVGAVALYGVPGNHGKVGGKRAGATPADYSWDWLAVELIKDHLRDSHIDLAVNVPSGALLFETMGNKFLVIHGDEIRGQMGLPFYGLSRFDGKAMRLAETVFDYGLLGHHHQPASIPNGSGGEFFMSGDWVGGNNLSKHIVAASRPQQRVLFVSEKHGVTEDARIYFDSRRDRVHPEVHKL